MISQRMLDKLNEQLQKEFYSAYFYLSMEAYLADQNLSGFANFFRVQTQEERDHALKFFDYIIQVGGRVVLGQINAPQTDFKSPEEVFRLAYEHEQYVTKSIYELVDIAMEEKDHKTSAFLQWFVTEQAEEEASMDSVLRKLKFIGDDARGLLMIDSELAQRVYAPPSPTQA